MIVITSEYWSLMDIDPFYGYRPDSITYPGGDRYPSRYCTPNLSLKKIAWAIKSMSMQGSIDE